jgi:hypothetical protein
LKMRKQLPILQVPRLVLFNQLKNHTSSEKPRSHRERLLFKRLLPREEPKLPDGHSNSM